MEAVKIGILVVLLLMSLYSCLDHIFVPHIKKRIKELEKRVEKIEDSVLPFNCIDNTDNNERGKDN